MKTRHQHWIAPTFIAQREKERRKEAESAVEKDGKSILTELREESISTRRAFTYVYCCKKVKEDEADK